MQNIFFINCEVWCGAETKISLKCCSLNNGHMAGPNGQMSILLYTHLIYSADSNKRAVWNNRVGYYIKIRYFLFYKIF